MNNAVTNEVYRYLLNHICELQNRKISIVNAFAKDYQAYMRMLDFINRYVAEIENYLDGARIRTGEQALPFVILDSIVHVRDDGGKTAMYKIALPERESKETARSGIKEETCFSETAKALLFAKADEEVTLDETKGKIEKIEVELLL